MKSVIRKFAAVVLVVLMCLIAVPSAAAYGDLSWEAAEEYTDKYMEYAVPLDRSFICTNPNGSPIRYDVKNEEQISKVNNGEIVFLSHSCLYDGEFWGLIVEESGDNRQFPGWVKISDFLVYYDFIAFEEEHRDEIYEYEGDYSEFDQVDTALMWTWPGSGQYIASIEVPEGAFSDSGKFPPFRFDYAYRDTDGREWGFVAKPHISRPSYDSYWICISDPTDRELPVASGNTESAEWESDTPHTDIATLDPGSVLIKVVPIIALVLAVVIGTVILVRVLWRPKEACGDLKK